MNLFNINIELDDIFEEFSLDNQQMKQVVESVKKALLIEIHRNWSEAASTQLNSTRQGYLRGLSLYDEGEGKGGIRLIGTLNNMVESGCGPFDMKAGFMKSSKIKYSKKGNWYLSIPFRFATPGSLGENEVFSGVLPQEIYNIIKTRAISRQGKAVLKDRDLPSPHNEPKTRQSVIAETINKTFEQYTHKSAIFQGLMKQVNTNSSGGSQTSYNTFRTVGALSNPNAWIHKGIKQHNLSNIAMQNTDVDTITNNVVDKTLSDFGF